jgi:hypothetical protein
VLVLHVGLDSWIIQDGNHEDFERGAQYRFALEFYPHTLTPSAPTRHVPAFHRKVGALHDVTACVVRRASEYWVIDFGLPAFQEAAPPPWAEEGTWFEGSVYIGVDPFFYFERLKDEVGMPNLFRRWTIRRILLETTPWQDTTDSSGGSLRRRAAVPPTYLEVGRTDAWQDDDQNAHYILECELVAG